MKSFNWKEILLLGLIVIVFFFIIYSFVNLHYQTIYNQWELDTIEEKGKPTQALITDKYYSGGSYKSMEHYTLDYEYQIDDQVFNKCKYIDVIIHDYNQIGDSIEIKYLENNPIVSDIPGNWGLEIQWMQLIIIDIILLICILIIIWKYRKKRKADEFRDSDE